MTDLDVAEAARTSHALLAGLEAIGNEPPLDGLAFGEAFDDWRSAVVPVLERRLRTVTMAQIESSEAVGDHTAVRALADAWTLRDPLDEAVAVRAISAELALGDRSAAERRFRSLAQLLKAELDTVPDASVLAALGVPAASPAVPPSPEPSLMPEPVGEPAEAPSVPTLPATRGRWPIRHLSAIAIVLIGLTTAVVLLRPTVPQAQDPVVAVLPFQATGTAEADRLFALGIAEETMEELATNLRIKVMGRATAAALATRGQPSPNRLSALGVTHLVSGVVRSRADGSGLAVEARLVDSRTGALVWRGTFDSQESGMATAGQGLARRVSAELGHPAAPAQPGPAAGPPPGAYHRIRLARQHIHSREASRLIEGWELARQAVDLAPQWAEAHATRSIAASLMQNYTDMPVEPLAAEAGAAAARAIALDPDLPMAQSALSFALEGVEPDKALAAASRAVLLQPGNAAARRRLAWLLSSDGQVRLAIAELEAAVAIDPLWLMPYLDLCIALGLTNEPSRLIALNDRFASLDPPSSERRMLRANLLLDTGRAGEAVPMAAELMRTHPEFTYAALTWADALMALFGAADVPAAVEALNTLPALAALVRGNEEAAVRLAVAEGSTSRHDPEIGVVVGHALLKSGRMSELARAHTAQFRQPGADREMRSSTLAFRRHPGLYAAAALAATGNPAEAARVRQTVKSDVQRLERGGLAISQSSITTAALDLMEGRPGPAMDRLEAGMAAQWTSICHGPIWIGTDPLLKPLARNPRFTTLARRCAQRLNVERKAAGLSPLPRL